MTAAEVLAEIEPLGLESYRKVLRNHGIPDPMYGVKIEYLKVIQKRVKKDYQLAKELFDTGVFDAQYLAGLIADDAKMTKDDLNHWAAKADNKSLSESTVPWVAAEGQFGWDLALEWIDSDRENMASTGWSTLSCLVSLKENRELDLDRLQALLKRAQETILQQPNRVRSVMNGFIIAVGSYVAPLADVAMETALKIGKVQIDVGATDCKVPYAPDYINKARARGSLDKKKKTVKC